MPVSWRPARRFLTKVLQFLSAVGSPYRTWPVRAFGPCTGQTRRPSPDPLPASCRPRRSTGRSFDIGNVGLFASGGSTIPGFVPAALLDHLVGGDQEVRRNSQAEFLCRL